MRQAIAGTVDIVYRFHCDDGKDFEFPIQLDAKTLNLIYEPPAHPPEWTELERDKCSGCQLDRSLHTHCPTALALQGCVERFSELLSYEEVDVTVEVSGRTVTKRTSMQKALSSLMGLSMATSGCPSLSFLKPMARFHQPFATRLETLYRATSAYMLGQYFLNKHGQPCDLDMKGLQDAYERIHCVNLGIARRLRGRVGGDANMNALVLLDLIAQELPGAVEEQMQEIEHLFQEYLERSEPVQGSSPGP